MENWQPTRFGGLRRTGVPQKYDEATEALLEPKIDASINGEANVGGAEARPEDRSDKSAVGWFKSPLPYNIIIKINERLGLPDCPYVIRWRMETPWFSIRLHHWLSNDDDRAFHDHPWDFVTFVLRGGYTDANPEGRQHLRAPTWQYRSATHKHTVFPDPGGAWTLVITGPKIRSWGFWVNGRFRKANKYFASHGHHPCS